ncbi:MAG: N-acetylmuramoyl-L-alanine amidase [Clostridiaceae bacterium]|nr:N-acetylmuramoyl-L-alanine amidase [Clostridiaceae bacterium]
MRKWKILNITVIVTLILLTGCNNSEKATQVKKIIVAEDKSSAVASVNTEPAETVIAPPVSQTVDKKPEEPVTSEPEVKKPVEPNTIKPEVKPKEVTPKVVVQAANKVIVIDPGHANKSNLTKEALAPGPDSSEMKIKDGGGAQGVVTKTPEYLVNMRVAMKLKTLLEASGFKVVMTKTDNSLSLGNIERANIGNNANANLVIRIHADSEPSGSATGASMLVPAAINANTKAIHDESKRCGTIILNTLTSEVGMKKRNVDEHSDMTGFNWSKVPVILVELGFLSNANEDKLLSSDDYQNKIAQGLLHGIIAAEK